MDIETEVWKFVRAHLPKSTPYTKAREIVDDIVAMVRFGENAKERSS